MALIGIIIIVMILMIIILSVRIVYVYNKKNRELINGILDCREEIFELENIDKFNTYYEIIVKEAALDAVDRLIGKI